MAFTYIWHQLHLHRKKITVAGILLLCLLGATEAEAQRRKKIMAENKPGYDEKRIHYGFYLAMPLTRYSIEHSQAYADQLPNGIKVNPKFSPGFYTGLVLNVRLFDYLDARFVPGVGFYGRETEFTEGGANGGEEPGFDGVIVSSTMVELPVLLKYRSKRRNNFRPYLVAGVKPGIDLGSRKDTSSGGTKLKTEKYDLALEYGVGLDIFYPYFKFAPELRFSHGLFNQKDESFSSPQSDLIDKMTNHNISFILFFE
ncbi:type IX secretion/gliding motility protein PorT/SprT [Pontibacter roseus]|uniref:type IX secretion/gliding motility protein PorT/SprT n=1 Tax=Pontibacter roseus TaxID=336989 RepID=UPI000373A4B8|nr:porin family protein [Pontibacter roseus]